MSPDTPRVAIIIPFYGRLREYFPAWLVSCGFNPTVDWYLFIDDRTRYEYPPNVHIVYTTFANVRHRFQRCFDFPIALDRPYKLTDFKPTYGLVFSDYLADYDFWGYGDIDVVYGDIRQFLTQEVLACYDKVLCHGHFSLLRNTVENNNLFRRSVNGRARYRQVYAERRHFGFDEYGPEAFHTICRDAGLKIYVDNTIYADLTSFKRHFVLTWCHAPGVLRPEESEQARWEEGNDSTSTIFSFDRGRLTRLYVDAGRLCEKDYMYVHFQKRPMQMELSDVRCDRFMAVPNRFVDYIDLCDKTTVQRLGRKRLISSRRWRRRVRVCCRQWVKKRLGI